MKTWPLRRKLQILTAAVVVVVLVLFGVGTAINLYFEQIEAIDDRLAQEAAPLLDEMERENAGAPWFESDEGREIMAMLPDRYIAVRAPGGETIYASGNLRDLPVPGLEANPGFKSVRAGDATLRVGSFDRAGFRVALGVDLDEAENIVGELMLAYLLALPLAVLAAAIGVWWITEKALAPIAEIAATAEEVTAHRLDARLPEPLANDEIARLSHVLNRMFDRLERAFRSATRFTADASHELRTPLTIMRGRIEEAINADRDAPGSEALLVDILEENTRLSAITDNLLLLAKADAWQLELDLRETNLSQLVEEVLEDGEILAAARDIEIEKQVQPGVVLLADAGRLRQVLLNLLDNAVKYGESGGRIRVTLDAGNGDCVCSIANSGPCIPADKAGQIFERFFRGDAARGGDGRGSGLGLSICRELVHLHGGRIELAENRPGHVEFRVTLPLRRA